ncbi:hypothetical protein [Chryseobacterium hagamense]|uniref:Uncharacterized protein n=1 Tax=Chryseobacterium hagamense TaxID=395935 RepID=A0A511YL82_9FLAO|nr:hypothetical protein [Chryseobacterium hagamense]GEN75953.1 hypothetical protein CHA01nite_16930 [Chryseobacterium hagamense]
MEKINIPDPCSEDWDRMTPFEKGRFCAVCNKCVIDFTQKTPSEVRQILAERKNEKTCGRFYTVQLDPVRNSGKVGNPLFGYLPSALRNSSILLGMLSFILFLAGCSKKHEDFRTTGLIVSDTEQDSIRNKDVIIGETVIPEDPDTIKMPAKDNVRYDRKMPEK